MQLDDCLAEIRRRLFDNAKEYQQLEQQIVRLQYVSGYTVEDLTRLFAAGYTLSPPEPPKSLSDYLKGE